MTRDEVTVAIGLCAIASGLLASQLSILTGHYWWAAFDLAYVAWIARRI